MSDFSRDGDGTAPVFSRRSILKSAMVAGLPATAVAALSSILPMRAFAQDGTLLAIAIASVVKPWTPVPIVLMVLAAWGCAGAGTGAAHRATRKAGVKSGVHLA